MKTKIMPINLLFPKTDQSLISPYSVTISASTKVTRIKEMIIEQKLLNWCLDQLLLTGAKRNTRRPVERYTVINIHIDDRASKVNQDCH